MTVTLVIVVLVSLLVVIGAVSVLHREKRQVAEITAILADVASGNGNRRMLARPSELLAPLAYQINEIVAAYEDKLAAVHQNTEANKQLMTSLSHDVRTPLTTLIGYLDTVADGRVSGRERDDYIDTARRKAYDLKDYIDVLFDWFKLNSGEFTIDIVPVDAGELTRNILIDWIPVLESHQLAYEIEIPDQSLKALLDIDSYTRVLNNLLQNILVHSQASTVTVTLTRQGEMISLTLADDGIGIAKDDLKLIFNRLYKVDEARSAKGSGLGLAIVHQLVTKMAGQVSAESTPGLGTSFTILLPAHSD